MKFRSFYYFEDPPDLFERALSKSHAAYLYFHSLPKEEQDKLRKESAGLGKEELIGYLSACASAGKTPPFTQPDHR